MNVAQNCLSAIYTRSANALTWSTPTYNVVGENPIADSFDIQSSNVPSTQAPVFESQLSFSESPLVQGEPLMSTGLNTAVAASGCPVLKLVLLGSESSSKRSLANSIASSKQVPHVHMGDLIKAEIKSGSELGRKIAESKNAGQAPSPESMGRLLQSRLHGAEFTAGYVLDAMPTDVASADIVKVLSADADVKFVEITRNCSQSDSCNRMNRTLQRAEKSGTYFQVDDDGDSAQVEAVVDALVENFSSANSYLFADP